MQDIYGCYTTMFMLLQNSEEENSNMKDCVKLLRYVANVILFEGCMHKKVINCYIEGIKGHVFYLFLHKFHT